MKVPASVGVPETTPFAASVRPAGSAPIAVHDTAPVPPVVNRPDKPQPPVVNRPERPQPVPPVVRDGDRPGRDKGDGPKKDQDEAKDKDKDKDDKKGPDWKGKGDRDPKRK